MERGLGSVTGHAGERQSALMIAYTHYESDPRVIRAAEAAVEAGFAVDFIALRRPGEAAIEMIRGVRLFRIGRKYRGASRLKYLLSYVTFFLRCLVASTRMYATRRYKVIHVNNMPDVLVFSVLVPKLFGSKVILDIHDPMPETFGSKFKSAAKTGLGRTLLFLERMSVAFADKTITVSDPVKHGVLLQHGYPADAIGVVANFADDKVFKPMAYPPVNGTVRFAFHGTILERNGLRTLVDALAQARHRDRIHVRIIGDGDFSPTLSRLIAENGLEKTVEFVNRVYPLYEIPGLLADCHVGVIPLDASTIANFALPLKLIEYTCLGMPSITIRNAAIEHYLKPDECMYFESGDAKSLARMMDEVVEKPDCLVAYREKLKDTRQRVLWSREKDKYVAMLRELAGTI